MNKFKSADELGILEHERDGLIKTLEEFETGGIQTRTALPMDARDRTPLFDMAQWQGDARFAAHRCGTARCIGGWTEFFMNIDREIGAPFVKIDHRSERANRNALDNLFYDGEAVSSLITVKQGAQALRTYLETGTNQAWAIVLGHEAPAPT